MAGGSNVISIRFAILITSAFCRDFHDLMKFTMCVKIIRRFMVFLRMAHEGPKLRLLQRHAKEFVCREVKCLII